MDQQPDRPGHPRGVTTPPPRQRIRQPLPLGQSPQRSRLDRRYQRLASACCGCRAGCLVARTGADPHAGDHLLPLPGEQGVQARHLFPAEALHGKGGHGVHRPLHGEIRRQGEGGSSPRRGYRRPNGTRRERGAQGDQGTAASLVRPDDTPERGQQPVWFFGRKNARHRPVALREEVHHLSPYRLTLYIGRCGRGDSGTHREHDTLSPFRGIRGQDGYRISLPPKRGQRKDRRPPRAASHREPPLRTGCRPPHRL